MASAHSVNYFESKPDTCLINTEFENSIHSVKRKSLFQSSTTKRPKLEYAAAVWDPHLISDKNTLEKVHRHAARYVKGIYTYNASVTQMLNELEVGIT